MVAHLGCSESIVLLKQFAQLCQHALIILLAKDNLTRNRHQFAQIDQSTINLFPNFPRTSLILGGEFGAAVNFASKTWIAFS